MQAKRLNWQQIIWREWRHCQDPDYAQRLFELVASQPVGWGAKGCLMLFEAITGAALATMIGLVLTIDGAVIQQFIWAGGVIGASRGYLAGRSLTWQGWLQRLSANSPTSDLSRFIATGLMLGLIGGLIFGPVFWLLMAGLFWGVGGLVPWLTRGSTKKKRAYAPEDRHLWFWWRSRPPLPAVEAALRWACVHSPAASAIWAEPLRRLTSQRQPTPPVETLVSHLLSDNWVDRFIARHNLVSLGQPAIAPLQQAANGQPSVFQQTAHWLVHNIERPSRPYPQPEEV